MKGYRCSAVRENEVTVVLVTPLVIMRNVYVTSEIRAALRCGLCGTNKEGMNSHGTNEIPVCLLKFLT
jgi:hypothetical protein